MDWESFSFGLVVFTFIVSEIGHFIDRGNWRREREELLNRIMAKHLGEFDAMKGGAKPPKARPNWLREKIISTHRAQRSEMEEDDE